MAIKIDPNVSYEDAAFIPLASVALQSIRNLDPKIGENINVIGLGIVGLLVVKILIANGCNVFASDLSEERLSLARIFGAKAATPDEFYSLVMSQTEVGSDSSIICTSTDSNEVISNSIEVTKKRGAIVLVGTAGMNLNRQMFYDKEIKFEVSSSYGPGRYDPLYESKGIDYPISYVRWTLNRNFKAINDLLANRKVSFKDLVSKTFSFNHHGVNDAYKATEKRDNLGIIFDYESGSGQLKTETKITLHKPTEISELN